MVKVNSKVKVAIVGGCVYAIVISIHESEFEFDGKKYTASKQAPMAIVETPIEEKGVKTLADLMAVTDEEYNQGILNIVNALTKSLSKPEYTIVQSELDKVKTELDEAKKVNEGLTKEKETLSAQIKEVNDKLAEINRKTLALKRMKEMSDLNAFEGSEEEAIKQFGNLTDEVYAQIKLTAQAVTKKLTEQGKTNLPKATDQTQTDKTKLTQAEDTAKDVKDATVETDPDLANSPKDTKNTLSPLRSAFSRLILGNDGSN